MTLQTEHPFTLPRGYLDAEGNLHREGVMRLRPSDKPEIQASSEVMSGPASSGSAARLRTSCAGGTRRIAPSGAKATSPALPPNSQAPVRISARKRRRPAETA